MTELQAWAEVVAERAANVAAELDPRFKNWAWLGPVDRQRWVDDVLRAAFIEIARSGVLAPAIPRLDALAWGPLPDAPADAEFDEVHDSDCAIHNAPAEEPGECDCSLSKTNDELEEINGRLA